jgi:hypothetical protein
MLWFSAALSGSQGLAFKGSGFDAPKLGHGRPFANVQFCTRDSSRDVDSSWETLLATRVSSGNVRDFSPSPFCPRLLPMTEKPLCSRLDLVNTHMPRTHEQIQCLLDRAEECRTLAGIAANECSAKSYMTLADAYELLAEEERRLFGARSLGPSVGTGNSKPEVEE